MMLLVVGIAARVYRSCRLARVALRESPESRRRRRWFHTVNLAQWVLIIGVIYSLQRGDLSAWIPPAVMLVVGLHMLPLAHVFRYRPYYLTGAALIATALGYPFAARGGPASALGCLITGVVLWLTAAWVLLRITGGRGLRVAVSGHSEGT
jgi:hypothetical protein